MKKSLVVAGFGAFPGQKINPSELAVRALEKRRRAFALAGVDLHVAVLPVERFDLSRRLCKLFAETAPDAVLLLGVAARRRALSVEICARNRLSLLKPDMTGHAPWTREIVHGAPAAFATPAPAARLAAQANAKIPARVSRDAGAYLCNEAYYLSLLMDRRALFVHMPDWRGALLARGVGALETMAKALVLA